MPCQSDLTSRQFRLTSTFAIKKERRRTRGEESSLSGCDRKRTDGPFSTERTVRSLSITTTHIPIVILSDRLCITWLTSFNVKMLWMNNILFCGIIIIFIFCVALCEANAQMMPLPPVITLSDVNGTLKRYWTPSNMHVLMRGIYQVTEKGWMLEME